MHTLPLSAPTGLDSVSGWCFQPKLLHRPKNLVLDLLFRTLGQVSSSFARFKFPREGNRPTTEVLSSPRMSTTEGHSCGIL
jgi:hypothetical protein